MEPLIIKGTYDIPDVRLDPREGVFEISGKSLPEDVLSCYKPVFEWLDEYMKNPLPKTIFNFKLTYFNTASSKILLDIMLRLEEFKTKGNDVVIRWNYSADDNDMLEAGTEYSEIVNVPFEFVPFQE